MNASLACIRRHPVKSAGGEGLDRVTLTAGCRLPGDREWAVLTEAGERHAQDGGGDGNGDGGPDGWLPKSCFLRGVRAPQLQAVTGGWVDGRLALRHPARPDVTLDPATEGARLVAWLRPLWPDDAPAPTRLVRGAGVWTDEKQPWVSILSLASLRDLEARTGRTLGLHRWRGNLWVEGWAPWAERAMIGQIIRIGDAVLRVTEPIGRCKATDADTNAGARDIDMLAALERHCGRTDFGVFAEVVSGGTVAPGDAVTP